MAATATAVRSSDCAMILSSPHVRSGRLPDRRSVWWGFLVPDDKTFQDLIVQIARQDGRMNTHEAECAGRYGRIEDHQSRQAKDIGTIREDISRVAGLVEGLAKQGHNAAWSANWKAWVIATLIMSGLLGGMAWTAGQLYALEPLRVQAATKK